MYCQTNNTQYDFIIHIKVSLCLQLQILRSRFRTIIFSIWLIQVFYLWKIKTVTIQQGKKEMFLDKRFLYTQQRTRRKNANVNAKKAVFQKNS